MITISPITNNSGSGSILVTVTDDFGGSDTEVVNINIIAVPDVPNLSTNSLSGTEDVSTLLNILSSLNDNDGSENLSLVFDMPDGCTLSNGTNNNDGTWTVLEEQIAGLSLSTPIHFNSQLNYYSDHYRYDISGTLNINVTAISTES